MPITNDPFAQKELIDPFAQMNDPFAQPVNPEDTQEATALGAVGQVAKAANESVTEFIDFLGPGTANAALRLMDVDYQLPTVTGKLQEMQEAVTGDARKDFLPKGTARDVADYTGLAVGILPGFVNVPRAAGASRSLVQDFLGLGNSSLDDAGRMAERTTQALRGDAEILGKQKMTGVDEIFEAATMSAKRDVIRKNRVFMDQHQEALAQIKKDTPKGSDTLLSDVDMPVGTTKFSLNNVLNELHEMHGVDPKDALAAIKKKGGIQIEDDPIRMAEAADVLFKRTPKLEEARATWADYLFSPMSDVLRKRVSPEVGGRWEKAVETSTRNYEKAVIKMGRPIEKVAELAGRNRELKATLLDIHKNPKNINTARMIIKRELGKEGLESFNTFMKTAGETNTRARKLLYKPGEGFDDVYHIHAEKMAEDTRTKYTGKAFQDNRQRPSAFMGRSRKWADEMDDAELAEYHNPILSHLKFLGEQDQMLQIAEEFGLRPTIGKNSTSSDFFNGVANRLRHDGFDDDRAVLASEVMHDAYMGTLKAPHPAMRAFMSLAYAGTLAQLKSATLNLHDVFVSAVNQGVVPTMKSMMKGTKGEFGKSLVDMGLGGQSVGEFVRSFDTFIDNPALMDKVARGAHKVSDVAMSVSGFKAMDRIGKGVVLRSAVHEARGAAKAGKLVEKFGDVMSNTDLKKMRPYLAEGMPTKDMPQDIQKLVEELAFTKLGQQQLISVAGRPAAYAGNPNARPMYAMTGFAIKQFALLRNNVAKNIKKGNVKEAAMYAAKYAAFAGLGYGLIDETRSSLFKDQPFHTEDIFWGALEQTGAVMTMNRVGDAYSLSKMTESPVDFLLTSLMPPAGLVGAGAEDVADLVMKGEYNAEVVKKIPLLGDFYKYYWADKVDQNDSKGDKYRQVAEDWGE